LADCLRPRGATIAWVQTSSQQALRDWPMHHAQVLSEQRAAQHLSSLSAGTRAFELYPGLTPAPGDLRVTKTHYSAFIQGSSELDAQLRARGVDTLLVTGTATNVYCESSTRDASMLN
jgi:ureidoacrylate peracid hydrolase